MLDYIWHRIKAIRNEKVIDFLDHFTPIESFDLTPFEGNSELIQFDAKVRSLAKLNKPNIDTEKKTNEKLLRSCGE